MTMLRYILDLFRLSWVSFLLGGYACVQWQAAFIEMCHNCDSPYFHHTLLVQLVWLVLWVVPISRAASRACDFEAISRTIVQNQGEIGAYQVAQGCMKLITRGRADVFHAAVMQYGDPAFRDRAYLREYYTLPVMDRLKIHPCVRVYHWFVSVL